MPQRPGPEQARASVRSFLVGLGHPSEGRRSPTEALQRLIERAPAPGAALGWLLAHEPDRALRECAMVMLFTAAKDPSVPRSVRRPILKAAGPILSRAFHDPEIEDEVKYMVGPALSLCGIEIADDAYARAFRDQAGVVRRMTLEAFRSGAPVPEYADDWLERHEPRDEEAFADALETARLALEANPPLGAILLVTLAAMAHERKVPLVPSSTLDSVAATRNGTARWMLRIAEELPAMGPLGERARRLAAELGSAGVDEQVPEAGTFERGILSMIDGAGSRQVVLQFRRGRSRDRDALNLMPNDEVGLKDAFCVYRNGQDVLRVVRDQRDISMGPCGVPLARAVVADALALHERTHRPVPGRFLLYRHFLGQEPLLPAVREPDLSAYGLGEVEIGPDLVARSKDLVYRPDCHALYCASDAVYAFLRDRLDAGAEEDGLVVLNQREMEAFIDDIAAEHRPELLKRIAINLEVEALAGRAGRKSNQRLARLWLGLRHEVVPFAEVPFVVELAREGIAAVLENVLQGYETQAEANAAALEPEEDESPF